ncbi:MAG: sulfurtransferase TusA family protein [Deltaproteobacteria bacterium]|nr:sulfurtransferase TusA family protein [Deltaproteobacteria bacterium]
MEIQKIDAVGLRCPHPTLALSNATQKTAPGTLVEISGDCPSFEKDIREFCQKKKKMVLTVNGKAPLLTIQIQF